MHDLRGFSAAKSRDVVEKTFGEAINACKRDKVELFEKSRKEREDAFLCLQDRCRRYNG